MGEKEKLSKRKLEIQKFEYFENENSFLDEIKSIFHSYLKKHSQVWNNFWQLKPFNFTSKALFVLKIFKFLFWLFCHVAKRPDKKDTVNFKFHDVTAWFTNNLNTRIGQYFRK